MLEIESSSKGRTSLSLAPLIDVVFLLLIFFLLTSALASSDQFDITLPKSEAGRDPDEDPIILEINEDGEMAIGAMRLTEDSIQADLVRAAGGPEQTRRRALLIKADGSAYSDYAMDVVEAARKVKLAKVTIATTPQ